MQFRKARFTRKCLRQHLRAEARSAHAEHDGVAELLPFHALRKVLVVGDIGRGSAGQPAQPLVFVGPGPDRFVVLPEPAYLAGCAPVFGCLLDRLADLASEL